MKIILLSVVILFLSLYNVLAEQMITCKVETIDEESVCEFSGVTIGLNEDVSIKTVPEVLNVTTIMHVQFSSSSIYSVPREVFAKFPNVNGLWVHGQNIQEIQADTFKDAKKLKWISLDDNSLTFLRADTFEGLPTLKSIWMQNNRLSAIHPKMFSHLNNLMRLDLRGNFCIDKEFDFNLSKAHP
jgi:Leucine-rich repeat (LRR) protein